MKYSFCVVVKDAKVCRECSFYTSNTKVLITGASRGIGSSLAKSFSRSQEVTHVVLTARSENVLHSLQNELTTVQSKVITADLCSPEAPQTIIDETIQTFGQIDCIIHNAGTLGEVKPLADHALNDITAENYQQSDLFKSFQINLLSVMQITHFALPHLRKTNGKVIFISSGAAVKPTYGWSSYCVTKAGLNQLNTVLAVEEKDITFISVRPGVVDTEMQNEIRNNAKEGMKEEDHNKFIKFHEKGELKSPDNVADRIVALALHATKEFSGRFVSLEDEDVESLYKKHLSISS
jgi:short-subunit dehydrogenase